MASYAFIQKDDAGVETARLCATDMSPPLRLLDGGAKTPATITVGDRIKTAGFALRVDEIATA